MNTKIGAVMIFMASLVLASTSQAADGWLIATQSESLNSGQKILVEAIKPDSLGVWPDRVQLKLSGSGKSEIVELDRVQSNNISNTRQTYSGIPKVHFFGVVRAELLNQKSNRLLMLATSDDGIAPLEIAATTPASSEVSPVDTGTPTVVLAQPGDEPPLSANEPLYLILGSNDDRDTDVRFQISFKYRPFDPDATVAQFLPYASNLYFAYTQTSLWDIGGHSSPFKDTSYRPSLYYKWGGPDKGILPYEWKFGFEHESNGRAGDDSRSINTLFLKPTWNFDFAHGRRLALSPKFYQYVEKSDNSDIHKYRGYVDWQARFGREDGAILTALYRLGTSGHSASQLDFSYPISDKIFGRTGTFIYLQMQEGYGETLIDYDRASGVKLRLGISFVR